MIKFFLYLIINKNKINWIKFQLYQEVRIIINQLEASKYPTKNRIFKDIHIKTKITMNILIIFLKINFMNNTKKIIEFIFMCKII